MNKKDYSNRHFKGQVESEVVQCFYRKHWIVLLKDIVEFIIFIGALTFVITQFKGIYIFFSQDSFLINFLAFSMISLFTLFIHRFFLKFIKYYLDIVVITNYRIVNIDKSLYLRNSKDAIDLPKIQDMKKSQYGIIQRIFNFGELIITLSSTTSTKILRFVPNPEYHFRKINKLKRKYIKERLSNREPGRSKPVEESALEKEKGEIEDIKTIESEPIS